MNISEIRKKYPQYKDLTDTQIAQGFHQKFYSDIPYDEFAASIGIKPETSAMSLAQNLGAGIVEGVAAIPTAPRDIGMLVGSGVTYGVDRLRGLSPEQASAEQKRVQSAMEMYEQSLPLPSPLSLIERGFESYVKPLLPKAKTTPEQYARTIGQFAPAVISPGSAARRAAAVVVPAVASETAGKLTEGSAYEPWARLAAGVAGGVVSAPKTTGVRETAKIAPTEKQLAESVKKAYKTVDEAGIVYDPTVFKSGVDDLKSTMVDLDLDISAENVWKQIARLRDSDPSRLTPGFLSKKHAQFGKILADPTASGEAKLAASLARERIVQIMQSAPASSAKGLTGPEIAAAEKTARELASSQIKGRGIQRNIEKSATYQSGDVSGLRNQFSNLQRRLIDKGNVGWSPMELEALNIAAKGDIPTNIMNTVGRLGFDFGRGGNIAALGPVVAGTGAGVLGGLVPGLLVPAAGTVAKQLAKSRTRKQAADLQAVIRAGAQRQQTGAETARAKNAMARAIAVGLPLGILGPQTAETQQDEISNLIRGK